MPGNWKPKAATSSTWRSASRIFRRPSLSPIAVNAIKSGKTLYTQALGLPELRTAISDLYRERYGANVPASRIAVTNGASGALNLAFACLADPGSEWLLTDPGYPCNRHILRTYEGRPQSIAVGPGSNFQPTPAQVSAAWNERTADLLVASPANPTGTLLTLPQIAALTEVCRKNDGHFLVDEIYHGLTYAPKEVLLGGAPSLSEGAPSFAAETTACAAAGVAATPGLNFGSNAPEKHIRFAYTTGVGLTARRQNHAGGWIKKLQGANEVGVRELARR